MTIFLFEDQMTFVELKHLHKLRCESRRVAYLLRTLLIHNRGVMTRLATVFPITIKKLLLGHQVPLEIDKNQSIICPFDSVDI